MYLIKNGKQYLTKNDRPNNYPYPKEKYIWTTSYWMSNLFTLKEAGQLITEYGGLIVNQFEENIRLFKDFTPYNRVAFPKTL